MGNHPDRDGETQRRRVRVRAKSCYLNMEVVQVYVDNPHRAYLSKASHLRASKAVRRFAPRHHKCIALSSGSWPNIYEVSDYCQSVRQVSN